jgi:hypothetical protein
MKLPQGLLFLPVLLLSIIFTGCKDKKDNAAPSGHKVKYRATVTSSVIMDLEYITPAGDTMVLTPPLNVNPWESGELEYPLSTKHLYFSGFHQLGGALTDLQLEIIVDGVVKKDTSSGPLQRVSVTYDF